MKRLSFFKVAVVLVVAVVAFRFALESHALTSASFSFGGSYSRGGTGPKLVTCTLSPTSITMPKPVTGSEIQTQTATLACDNNLPVGTTLNISLSNVNFSPSIPVGDYFNWSMSGNSMAIPGKSSQSITFTFKRKKQDTGRTYNLTFTVNGSTNPQAMDYSPPGYQLTVIVQ